MKRRLLSALLAMAMLLTMAPTVAFAAEGDSGTSNVQISKTASQLDNDDTTNVTLQIGASSKNTGADVVFVLDKSTSNEVKNEALAMLDELMKTSTAKGLEVKVGVVTFNRIANNEGYNMELTSLNEKSYKEIKNIFSKELQSGTNVESGIRAGMAMLDGDTEVLPENKHLVLVTDGITYLWGTEPVKTVYNELNNTAACSVDYNVTDYQKIVKTALISDTQAAGNPAKWMQDHDQNIEALIQQYSVPYTAISVDLNSGTPYISKNNTTYNKYTSIEVASYLAAKAWKEAADKGYELYAFSSENLNYPWASVFFSKLNTIGGRSTLYTDNETGVDGMFDGVENTVLYEIMEGTINDVIGDDFDLTDKEEGITDDTFTLTVGGVEQDATVSDNTVNFGTVGENDEYPYALTYYPNGKDGDTREQFDLAINVPVETAKSLQLAYSLTLVNKSTEAGEYTVPTNEKATLTYASTDGSKGVGTFPVPNVSYTVEAEQPDPEPPVVNWEISKSKTATNLDENYESEVTLSLPSAEETLESDIVFVVDKSSSSRAESTEQGVQMLEDLNSSLSTTNATINVGIIVFDGSAHVMRELSAYDADDIKQKMSAAIPTEESTSGTNMESGLLAAKNMLEADTDVPDNRKHVIVVSDGLTRLFTAEDGVTTQIIFNEQYADGTTYFGDYTTWCLSNGLNDGEYKVPDGKTWLEYYTSTIKPQVEADGDTYVMDFDGDSVKNTLPEKYIKYNDIQNHAQAVDRAFYDAYNAYLNLSSKYQCYAVYTGNSELGLGFMSTLNNNATVDFDSIYDGIYYLLDAGSKVVDVIGEGADKDGIEYDFDFVDHIDNLTLTVGGTTLTSKKLETSLDNATSTYVFGEENGSKDGTTYPFILNYYANGEDGASDECFVWKINVPVSNFAPVQLTYTVKLTDPQSEEGTYGQYDKDGSKNYSGLYTNNSATLYPVDSNGDKGIPEEFAKPTVSYTVGAITVTPADITIYMGGDDGYDAVVGGEDAATGTVTSANSLPRPMFLINAPEDVDPEDLTFTSAEIFSGAGESAIYKAWKLKSAGKTADGETLYYMNAKYAAQGQDEVRVQFTEKDVEDAKPIVSDAFDPAQKNEMFVDYDIELYTNTVTVGNITVTDSEGNSYKLGTLGTGTLRVRAVDDTEDNNNPVTPVAESITAPVKAGEGAVTAPVETTYTLNDTTVEVNAEGVGLLFDGIIDDEAHDRTGALEDKVAEEMGPAASNVTRHHQAQYLDLVDANNGNAWVKASDNVTVYWGYPTGTDKNTKFTLYHFEGLHRDDSSGGSSGFNIGDINAETTKLSEVKINKDDNGISFEVGSGGFSPFVLVWETTNSGGGGGGGGHHDKPEDLNTEDHFAYIIGYPGGTVQPQGDITRAEVATIFFRMLTDEARAENWSQTNNYTDVAPADWYNNAISTLTNMGIISGEPDGSFRPNDPITRAEFTKIAVGFFEEAGNYVEGTFVDVPANAWYADFIDAAVDLGLIEGYPDGTIRPEATITRAEACTIVNRTLGRVPDKDHLLPEEDMVLWPDNSDVNAWYYAQMQEATNSHDYEWTGEGDEQVENWTEKLEDRDWDALETEWSEAGDAPGGEVMD